MSRGGIPPMPGYWEAQTEKQEAETAEASAPGRTVVHELKSIRLDVIELRRHTTIIVIDVANSD